MADTQVPSLTVIGIAFNQLATNASIITIYCLRLFLVYKHDMLHGQR